MTNIRQAGTNVTSHERINRGNVPTVHGSMR